VRDESDIKTPQSSSAKCNAVQYDRTDNETDTGSLSMMMALLRATANRYVLRRDLCDDPLHYCDHGAVVQLGVAHG
jgi:hypothetical protein